MRNYGSETHGLRSQERSLVASEYPSINLYRMPLTQFEAGQAAAGKFYMPLSGDSNSATASYIDMVKAKWNSLSTIERNGLIALLAYAAMSSYKSRQAAINVAYGRRGL